METEESFMNTSAGILPFTLDELQLALKKMGKKKSADARGILLEMFCHEASRFSLEFLNSIIVGGCIPHHWYESHFILLSKKENGSDPDNWRPVSILSISYKVLARLVYHQIRSQLDMKQSQEQFGFRPLRSVREALLIVEHIIGKNQLVEYVFIYYQSGFV